MLGTQGVLRRKIEPLEFLWDNRNRKIENLIINLILGRSPEIRKSAAQELAAKGIEAKDATSALIRSLRGDCESSVREMSAYALGYVAESTGSQVIFALKEALNDESPNVVEKVRNSLKLLGVEH